MPTDQFLVSYRLTYTLTQYICDRLILAWAKYGGAPVENLPLKCLQESHM